MNRTSRWINVLAGAAVACGRGERSADKVSQSPAAATASADNRPTDSNIPLASRPSNDCDWIPVADVEAIVGKLAEKPREMDNGCVYTLPIPQKIQDERAQMAKIREAIDKMPGAEKNAHPKPARVEPYGFSLEVDLKYFG